MFRRPKPNEIRIPPHSINSDANTDTKYRFTYNANYNYLNHWVKDLDKFEIENADDHPLVITTTLISKVLFYIAEKWCDFDLWVERQIIAKRRKKKKRAKTNLNRCKGLVKDILSSLHLLKWAKRSKQKFITEFVKELYEDDEKCE